MKPNLIEEQIGELADFLYTAIKEENTPWRKGWDHKASIAHNPYTGTFYQGFNIARLFLTTTLKGYSTNAYLTFQNVKELGGFVRKGEEATTLVHYGIKQGKDKDEIEKIIKEQERIKGRELSKEEKLQIEIDNQERGYLKAFNVFNLDQCENIDMDKIIQHQKEKGFYVTLEEEVKKKEFQNIQIVEEILKNSQIPFEEVGVNRAYYSPMEDKIVLPPKFSFEDEKTYYATALHELGHATGHESRLDRPKYNGFGSDEYAKEELRAELFSFLQGQKLNLHFDFNQHTSYLKSWLRLDKEEFKEVIRDVFKMSAYVEEHWYPKQNQLQLSQTQQIKQENQQITQNRRRRR